MLLDVRKRCMDPLIISLSTKKQLGPPCLNMQVNSSAQALVSSDLVLTIAISE